MDMNEILALNMDMYFDGKMNLMVGLCDDHQPLYMLNATPVRKFTTYKE